MRIGVVRSLFAYAVPAIFALAVTSDAVLVAQSQAAFPVIVVYNDNAAFAQFENQYQPDDRAAANPAAWTYQDRGVAGATQALERTHGFRAERVFSASIRGFSGRLTARQIADLETDALVAYVELDGVMSVSQRPGPTPPPPPPTGTRPGGGSAAQVVPWGIDRVDADISTTLAGNGSDSIDNVTVYIIDTGVMTTHQDLNVVAHMDFTGGTNADCNGHGTHVAGTAAARDNAYDVVGVAPGAPLVGVKVLACNGTGTTSGVIAGVDWVTANAAGKLAVANMSLGGGVSLALDNAVKNSAASGVFYAIAAGNSGANACNESPARAGAGTNNGIVTTAATGSTNSEASWSNYGSCVDIWAPGVGILSTKLGGATTTLSGTSMASPHVGGAGALFRSSSIAATPAEAESMLKALAVTTGTASKDGAAIQLLNAGGF